MSDTDKTTERVYDVPESGVGRKCQVREEVVELGEEFYLSDNETVLDSEVDEGWITLWIMKEGGQRVWALDDELVEKR